MCPCFILPLCVLVLYSPYVSLFYTPSTFPLPNECSQPHPSLKLLLATDIEHSGLKVDIEEVFCSDQVSSCAWEFQCHLLLVRLLLCQGLHLLSHLLVGLHQVLCLNLSSSQLLFHVAVSVRLHLHCALVVRFQVL